MHFQNAMSDIALSIVATCDKCFHYKCALGHSYLNTSERVQTLLNLALANHSCCSDLKAPKFITNKVLYSPASIKGLQETITNYNKEYLEAIKFVE